MRMKDIFMRERRNAFSEAEAKKTIQPSFPKPSRDSYQTKPAAPSRQQDGGSSSSRYQAEDHNPQDRDELDDFDLQDGGDVERDEYDHPVRPDVQKLGGDEDPVFWSMPSYEPRRRKPDPRIGH